MTGLFPEPDPVPWTLSAMYSVRAYRAGKGASPTWAAYSANRPCDECFAVQHEARDQVGIVRVRSRATTRRTHGGTQLLLCGAHAHLWKVRDTEDS